MDRIAVFERNLDLGVERDLFYILIGENSTIEEADVKSSRVIKESLGKRIYNKIVSLIKYIAEFIKKSITLIDLYLRSRIFNEDQLIALMDKYINFVSSNINKSIKLPTLKFLSNPFDLIFNKLLDQVKKVSIDKDNPGLVESYQIMLDEYKSQMEDIHNTSRMTIPVQVGPNTYYRRPATEQEKLEILLKIKADLEKHGPFMKTLSMLELAFTDINIENVYARYKKDNTSILESVTIDESYISKVKTQIKVFLKVFRKCRAFYEGSHKYYNAVLKVCHVSMGIEKVRKAFGAKDSQQAIKNLTDLLLIFKKVMVINKYSYRYTKTVAIIYRDVITRTIKKPNISELK